MIYCTVVKILLFVDIFYFFLHNVLLSIKDTTVCYEMEHKKQIEVYIQKKKEVTKKLPFVRVE